MSALVLAAIDAGMLELERLVPTPGPDLGYGSDLSCVGDVTEDLAEVDPYSPLGVGEAVIRRLTTARGTLPDDPDYGIDLRTYCNRGTTTAELRDLAGMTRSEVLKDDRIADATVTLTAPNLGTLRVEVRLALAIEGVDPFSLTIAVTSGSALLEAIG